MKYCNLSYGLCYISRLILERMFTVLNTSSVIYELSLTLPLDYIMCHSKTEVISGEISFGLIMPSYNNLFLNSIRNDAQLQSLYNALLTPIQSFLYNSIDRNANKWTVHHYYFLLDLSDFTPMIHEFNALFRVDGYNKTSIDWVFWATDDLLDPQTNCCSGLWPWAMVCLPVQ